VYVFRDTTGRALYVGKASDLRARVRSYFSSDTRRKVGGLLRETARIDHLTTPTALEAAVTEVRLIHELLPRYNRQGTTWHKAAYLKLTVEPFPRLSVVKRARDDGATYLGPLSSARVARQVADAVESALPVRRCTADPTRQPRDAPCAPAQLGVSTCPCSGSIDERAYAGIAVQVRRALTTDPDLVLDPLQTRMQALARAERYEEAADVRDRARAFADAHRRVRRFDLVQRAGRLVVRLGQHRAVIERGRLRHSEPADTPSLFALGTGDGADAAPMPPEHVQPADVDELTVLAGWLERNAGRIRVEHCEGTLCTPLPRLPDLRGA
jgi:DNA polymerase III subunit epsilon